MFSVFRFLFVCVIVFTIFCVVPLSCGILAYSPWKLRAPFDISIIFHFSWGEFYSRSMQASIFRTYLRIPHSIAIKSRSVGLTSHDRSIEVQLVDL